MPNVPDSSVGSRATSLGEPEQELVPPSREVSDQPVLPPLQRALRRSPEVLGGLPMRRNRSRSPPRALMTVSETPNTGKCIHGFLARRINNKSAAARAKELNVNKSTGAQREGILEARKNEWGNWQGFDAVDVIPPGDVQATLEKYPEAEVTPTRWVDIDRLSPGSNQGTSLG